MSEKLVHLHHHVSTALCTLEDDLHAMGLRTVTRFTLIARDPANPQMAVCVTNDVLSDAFANALALEQTGTRTGAGSPQSPAPPEGGLRS